jgi:hypothetical protein
MPKTAEVGIDPHIMSFNGRMSDASLPKSHINSVNFTFKVKHLHWRNGNCKKDKWALLCEQGRSWRGGRARWETQSWKRIPSSGRSAGQGLESLLPSCRSAWMAGSAAQTEHIPQARRVGEGPAAVKNHFCILRQERMSGSNSMCLVLRTTLFSSHSRRTVKAAHLAPSSFANVHLSVKTPRTVTLLKHLNDGKLPTSAPT